MRYSWLLRYRYLQEEATVVGNILLVALVPCASLQVFVVLWYDRQVRYRRGYCSIAAHRTPVLDSCLRPQGWLSTLLKALSAQHMVQ